MSYSFKKPKVSNLIQIYIYRCNVWKRRSPGVYMTDVYDGSKWESMLPWLNEDGFTSLFVQLNIDWFGPYNNTQYSFGAIYMSVLNLPREIRYNEENVLLLGE